jgi:presenilin-like A22 family membrane protease
MGEIPCIVCLKRRATLTKSYFLKEILYCSKECKLKDSARNSLIISVTLVITLFTTLHLETNNKLILEILQIVMVVVIIPTMIYVFYKAWIGYRVKVDFYK